MPEGVELDNDLGETSFTIQDWTLTTLREKLVKIGAKVVRHA